MPEDNQIQTWFQPEIQANPQIQQNNLTQNQQIIQDFSQQQIIQQDNIENVQQESQQTTKNQVQETKKCPSRFTKILSGILLLLWVALVLTWLWIHNIFEFSLFSSWYYFRDIIMDERTWTFFLAWIIFIIIWIKNLFKKPTLPKILTGISFLLWFALIWFWLYKVFQVSSDLHYSYQYATWLHYSIRDIIINSWILLFWLLWIWFIIVWILCYHTPNVNTYYHPSWLTKILSGIFFLLWIALIWFWLDWVFQILSDWRDYATDSIRDIITTRLTKILSGIYRFVWVTLIWAWLRNFSLIWTENLSFLKILYVWWLITLCGIWYILFWRLLYSTKNRIHLWISLLLTLVVNVMLAWILREFTDDYNYWYWIDSDSFELPSIAIIFFNLIYFSIFAGMEFMIRKIISWNSLLLNSAIMRFILMIRHTLA